MSDPEGYMLLAAAVERTRARQGMPAYEIPPGLVELCQGTLAMYQTHHAASGDAACRGEKCPACAAIWRRQNTLQETLRLLGCDEYAALACTVPQPAS